MATAAAPGASGGFRFRRLEKPEEFRQAEELARAADEAAAVPAPLLRALQDQGGLVLGGFADIYLAGVAVSALGWDGKLLYHYTHALVVRPEYRHHHLGSRLMGYQRDEVLGLGLSENRWAFDPLAGRAASLSVHRLGAIPIRYLPHYFGRDPDGPGGLETDRLLVRWPLADPRVEARLGAAPDPESDRARWARAQPIVETEPGEQALRVPTAVGEPAAGPAHLEIPFDLEAIREHEPKALGRWRHAVRDAFRVAFDLNYVVDDFVVVSTGHERRSFYLLSPPAPGGAPAP